jgi:hypothetical protein
MMGKRANAKSQATDAALSRQVACTDGLAVFRSENDGFLLQKNT